jgi:hypothetical protein
MSNGVIAVGAFGIENSSEVIQGGGRWGLGQVGSDLGGDDQVEHQGDAAMSSKDLVWIRRVHARTILLFALCMAAGLMTGPEASAAPKQILHEIGSAEAGELGGLFRTPRGVAVNQSGAGGVPAGTLYVVDSKNRRIQRFSPTGTFVSAWGFGVRSGNREFEICTVAEECRKDFGGEPRSAAGKLGEPKTITVDQATGNVYVADPDVEANRIDVYSATGNVQGAFGMGVLNGTSSLQFCSPQTQCKSPANPLDYGGQGGGFPGEIGGLAVDSPGNVYVANTAEARVDVFKPILTGSTVTGIEFLRSFGWGVATGAPSFEVCSVAANCKFGITGAGLGQFASNSPTDIAVDSEGNAFVLDAGNKRVQQISAASVPITANFGSAALESVFGPGAQLLNVAVDPSAVPNHLLVSGGRIGSGGKVAVAELDSTGANALGVGKAHGEDLPVTSANGLAVAKASIGGNVYLTTETAGELRGAYVLGDRPTIEPVTNITGSTATFKGNVVSNGIDVTFHFEYSTDGKSWSRLPVADVDAGTAAGTIPVEANAKGLTGSQLYRVRLVQNRPLGGGEAISAETTFTTAPAQPAIQGAVASPVKDTSATFNAYVDPQNQATTYRFEYGPADCSANPCTPLPVAEANGGGLRLVTQTATGLQPGTLYHYRLVAGNASGTSVGPDRAFETLVTGRELPDNRAYELVTPPDTGSVVLSGNAFGEVGSCFDTFSVSPDGNSVITTSKGGSLPGLVGNGRWDLYRSVRGEDGWQTASNSATADQTNGAQGGLCGSPEHRYSTLMTGPGPGDIGGLVIGGKKSSYLREPDGRFSLIGLGSLGSDPEANARWIAPGAGHVIFTSRQQLEPNAPGTGTEAVYDRSPGGATHVISLLPGDATPGFDAAYQGVSADGSVVLFGSSGTIGPGATLYARVDNSTTISVARGSSVLAGATIACVGGPSSSAGAPALTYRWLRDGVAIGGASSSTYTTQAADAGRPVQCQVTATNTLEDVKGGFVGSTQVSNPAVVVEAAPATAPPTAPNTIAAPTGTVSSGSNLSCASTGTWGGSPTFSRQWYRNGVAIPGATGTTYTLTAADVARPAVFQCAVTGTNAGGSVTKVSQNKATGATPGAPNPAAPVASSKTNSLNVAPAGVSMDGDAIFYLQSGNIVSVDARSQARTLVTNSGDATPVNVSDDGSHVFFISKSVLTGSEENPHQKEAVAGGNNLYVWNRSGQTTRFIATVDPKDVAGSVGLANWTTSAISPEANTSNGRANDPSRTTPDGTVFLFESRADVTGYDSGGHIEIYRYSDDARLDCVSCPPTGMPAQGDAALQRLIGSGDGEDAFVPTTSLVHIQNVTDDGATVFFETQDALVPADVNSAWDVYEWKVGQQPYLLSSGHNSLPTFLYGMSADGRDVFFRSSERLVPQDPSTVSSIYDARAGGGFPFTLPVPRCQDDNCQGTPATAPQFSDVGSATVQGSDESKRQRKRHHKKKRHHKRKHHAKRHHRANYHRGGAK